jgi:hypothetical protein
VKETLRSDPNYNGFRRSNIVTLSDILLKKIIIEMHFEGKKKKKKRCFEISASEKGRNY